MAIWDHMVGGDLVMIIDLGHEACEYKFWMERSDAESKASDILENMMNKLSWLNPAGRKICPQKTSRFSQW